jgi:hypothetical protein
MSIQFALRAARVAVVAAVCLGFTAPGAVQAASNAEQVVFSGIGLPPVSSAPFGFWIWCQVEQSGHSRGRYETDCNGAMYFYDKGVVRHVTGEVSEPDEGVYEMVVASGDGSVSCTLQNVPPIEHGPNNTVTATCKVNGEEVTDLMSTNAVVVSTGP